jgi:hypothetical protein
MGPITPIVNRLFIGAHFSVTIQMPIYLSSVRFKYSVVESALEIIYSADKCEFIRASYISRISYIWKVRPKVES